MMSDKSKNQKEAVKTPSISLEDLQKLGKPPENPLEKAMLKLSSIMFDKTKLMMTARLPSMGYAKMIIRNLIISDFFLAYYGRCKAEISFDIVEYPPYYERKVTSTYPNKEGVFQHVFKRLNTALLMITISHKGLGRDEIIKILEGGIAQAKESRLMNMFSTQPQN